MTNMTSFARGNAELLAAQSLMPGLMFAAEEGLRVLNQAREILSLPALRLVKGEEEEEKEVAVTKAPVRKLAAPTKRRKQQSRLSSEAKKRLGSATSERWRVVKEAGVNTHGKLPNAQDVQRAIKIIAKRAAKAAAA